MIVNHQTLCISDVQAKLLIILYLLWYMYFYNRISRISSFICTFLSLANMYMTYVKILSSFFSPADRFHSATIGATNSDPRYTTPYPSNLNTCGSYTGPGSNGDVYNFECNVAGRFLVVMISSGSATLTLCEVEVFVEGMYLSCLKKIFWLNTRFHCLNGPLLKSQSRTAFWNLWCI